MVVIAINRLPIAKRKAIVEARREATDQRLSMCLETRIGQLNRLRQLNQAPKLGPISIKALPRYPSR